MSDLDVERDLKGPARVGLRIAGSTRLVHSLEAAIRRRACRKAELPAVDAEVAFDVGIVIGIDDRYSLNHASRCREAVSGAELYRAVAGGRDCGSGNTTGIRYDARMAATGAKCSWAGANRAMTGGHYRCG